MIYSLMRESRVVIVYDGRAYGFDALANYNVETSFQEFKTLRRTIHRRTNYAHSKITAQDPTSISLALNFANGSIESNFFDWMGFTRRDRTLILPRYSEQTEPLMFDMYIINSGITMYFTSCYVANVDFILENSIPVLNVGIESGKFEEVLQPRNSYTIDQGQVLPFSPVRVTSNGKALPGVVSASLSFQQQCSWREDRSIFNVGQIYKNSRAIVNEMNASALVSMYYSKNIRDDAFLNLEPVTGLNLNISNQHISVDFPQTRITKRLNMTDVYRVEYDIIPTELSDPVTIHFLGENDK